jgi:putative ABC transport system permease protein
MFNLLRNKDKSFWKIGGYFLVFAFFVLALNWLTASKTGVEDSLEKTGSQFAGFILALDESKNSTLVKNASDEGFYVHNNLSEPFPLTLIEQIKQSPYVRSASPFLSFKYLWQNKNNRILQIGGFEPKHIKEVQSAACSDTDLLAGRLIAPEDKFKILLEETFAKTENLFPGDYLTLNQQVYEVIGMLSPGTRPAKADIYMSLDEAKKLINSRLNKELGEEVNMVLVDGLNSTVNSLAIEDSKKILGPQSSVVGYGCYQPASLAVKKTQSITHLIWYIVLISLVLLMSLMQYTSMMERKKELGILKAISWSDRTIMKHLLREVSIEALLGSVTGSIIAMLFLSIFPLPISAIIGNQSTELLKPLILLQACFLTWLIACLTAWIWSFLLLRIKPADILRTI